MKKEFIQLIKDAVNVKKVTFVPAKKKSLLKRLKRLIKL